MNKNATFVLAFSLGATVGAAVTWKLLKTKYELIAQEEIDSMREMYEEQEEEDDEPEQPAIVTPIYTTVTKEKPNLKDYASMLHDLNYNNYARKNEEKKEESESMDIDRPYVISPEEFDEFNDYETISLVYYADEVLTDEMGDPIDDIDALVGLDSLNHFGEYEDDSVFVRNDKLKCDYEILLDPRNYSDIEE